MTFQISTDGIPAEYSFWYRMALLDVQTALIDYRRADGKTLDEVQDGLRAAWEELFKCQQQARLAEEVAA